jgi:diaminohydroxyphosphoribosylaminopyrimidine deaminase/5-amino-6-(5-phosphoribosylamino)uracil reductase
MHRCIELAKQGAGFVAPNPMVGAVLVYEERIIGEGYHQLYGNAHAEVNCINAVSKEDEQFISKSTLYVSLEPCTHYGKTPPCTELIIAKKIPKVVVGCRDPFREVDGKGIEKLVAAGVAVTQDILNRQCIGLNKRFFLWNTKQRPFIILKWAQSANGKFANADYSRVLISNTFTNHLVHKWRSEESSILVGTNTALLDNPYLNVRLWNGANPVRLVVDMDLRLPDFLHVLDKQQRTVVFNALKHEEEHNLLYYQVTNDVSLVHQIVHALYRLKLQSVMIEGGAKLLQSFVDENMWDEARIITNEEMAIDNGINAPTLPDAIFITEEKIIADRVSYFSNPKLD